MKESHTLNQYALAAVQFVFCKDALASETSERCANTICTLRAASDLASCDISKGQSINVMFTSLVGVWRQAHRSGEQSREEMKGGRLRAVSYRAVQRSAALKLGLWLLLLDRNGNTVSRENGVSNFGAQWGQNCKF